MARIQLISGELDSALYFNKLAILTSPSDIQPYNDYYARGRIFECMEQTDSAIHYYLLAVKGADLSTKVAGYRCLVRLSSIMNLPDSAFYARQQIYWDDSLTWTKKTVEIGKLSHDWELSTMRHDYYNKALVAAICLFALFVVVSLILWKRQRKHSLELEQASQNLNRLQAAYDDASLSVTKEAQSVSSELHEKGLKAAAAIARSAIYKEKRAALSLAAKDETKPFKSTDKETLRHCILTEFDSFIAEAKTLGIFKRDEEYLFCCTLYLDFSSKEYRIIYNVEDNAIRMKRSRLKKRLSESLVGKELAKRLFS